MLDFFNFRYFLGEVFHTVHFQLLAGKKVSNENIKYDPIFTLIIFLISSIALLSTTIKKMKEKYKEWKFHKKININLNYHVKENRYMGGGGSQNLAGQGKVLNPVILATIFVSTFQLWSGNY